MNNYAVYFILFFSILLALYLFQSESIFSYGLNTQLSASLNISYQLTVFLAMALSFLLTMIIFLLLNYLIKRRRVSPMFSSIIHENNYSPY